MNCAFPLKKLKVKLFVKVKRLWPFGKAAEARNVLIEN